MQYAMEATMKINGYGLGVAMEATMKINGYIFADDEDQWVWAGSGNGSDDLFSIKSMKNLLHKSSASVHSGRFQ
ncbi:hypothetical protein QVD17_04822 [Tagetes erecta]|uniref:Uncharacterized protein n=1 Tax=Tagetes erecta TaxID=13708 RepID=A0AAD8PB15_TARER|nr:hypothetical protein QVD17_04822 [Tagetes erecta]